MNFCLECGAPLLSSPSAEQATALFSGPSATNSSPLRETQTVVTNFGQTPETQTIVSNRTPLISTFQTPPPRKNNTKIFLILGGILALLVLGGVAVVGIGLVAIYSQKDVVTNPTPTPFPTRTIERTSPIPSRTSTPAPPPKVSPGSEPSADYSGMRVEVNVKEGGQFGLRSYVSFTMNNLKGIDSYLAIYFQKNDGTPLIAKTSFRSKTGQVAVFKLLRPAYDAADYKDLELFIPYTALGLPPGKYDLQMDVKLIYKPDGLIKQLNVYDFEFEQK